MSIEVSAACWKLDLPRDQKLVLLAFADQARDDGYAWPSLARVAWKSGYEQTRSVSKIIDKLIAAGVLAKVKPAQGRTPTLYQVRPAAGKQLADFDPRKYKALVKGAKNASHPDLPPSNPLSGNDNSDSKSARGAQNAPQTDNGAVSAPQSGGQAVDDETVGGRSAPVGVRSESRRGALASAPESYNRIETRRSHAREGPDLSPDPRSERPEVDPKIRLMNNQAANLGISTMTSSESIESFQRRINEAQQRKMDADLERMRTPTAAGAG